MSTYQWECPDCEWITCGSEPPARCHCGQGHIIRNLTAEEEATDNTLQLEEQCREIEYNRSQFGRVGQ